MRFHASVMRPSARAGLSSRHKHVDSFQTRALVSPPDVFNMYFVMISFSFAEIRPDELTSGTSLRDAI